MSIVLEKLLVALIKCAGRGSTLSCLLSVCNQSKFSIVCLRVGTPFTHEAVIVSFWKQVYVTMMCSPHAVFNIM